MKKLKEIENKKETEKQPEQDLRTFNLFDLIDVNLAFNKQGYRLLLDIGSDGRIKSTSVTPYRTENKVGIQESDIEDDETEHEHSTRKIERIKESLQPKTYIS